PVNVPSSPDIHPLSLHDALPISTLMSGGAISTIDLQGKLTPRFPAVALDLGVFSNSIFAIVCPTWPCQTYELRAWDLAGKSLARSEEHTSELQSRVDLVCRLLLE